MSATIERIRKDKKLTHYQRKIILEGLRKLNTEFMDGNYIAVNPAVFRLTIAELITEFEKVEGDTVAI